MELPWATLFALLFMTMGPIRAVAIFSVIGTGDKDPEVRRLARQSAFLSAVAFILAIFGGTATLVQWGVSLPTLVGSAGIVLLALSLQSLLIPAAATTGTQDPATLRPSTIVFPGLFPPVAVTIPIIFAASFPQLHTHLQIIAIGLSIVLLNWLAMLRSKAILRMIGRVPLEILGAVFGVLQVALALQFIVNAISMA